MATSVTCPRCGAANNPGTMFCVNCGSALSAGAGPAAAPPMYPPTGPYGATVAGMPSAFDSQRRQQIDRTKTGVLLLLIGAILVILGRKAFGPAHSRNVMISILLFIIGFIVAIIAGAIFATAFVTGFFGGTPDAAAVQSAVNTFLIVGAISVIIGGLASIFFTYELQNKTGRYLLFAGYGTSVIIEIATFVVLSQALSALMASMFPNGTYDPVAAGAALGAFSGTESSLALLGGIPALIYAVANYMAWQRITRGEIPPPATPPSMPMMAPPAPPR